MRAGSSGDFVSQMASASTDSISTWRPGAEKPKRCRCAPWEAGSHRRRVREWNLERRIASLVAKKRRGLDTCLACHGTLTLDLVKRLARRFRQSAARGRRAFPIQRRKRLPVS